MAIDDLTMALMADPLNIQRHTLQSLENMLGGKATLVDPNSVAMQLVEMSAQTVSQFAMVCEQKLLSQYKNRAQTMEDLIQHLSDFDYVGFYSTPSQITMQIELDKTYIINNAKSFNENYKKLVIPGDTEFNVGGTMFGLYYPIDIRVDTKTGIPIVIYDITNQHPLMPLESNRVSFYEGSPYLGINPIIMEVPLYQFARSKITEVLIAAQGFAKKYQYYDNFYAIRLFTEVNGTRIELNQVMSGETYDPYKPTARVTVEPDTNTCSVVIPQIYFTSNMVGVRLFVELYTTKGDISQNVGALDVNQIKIDFKVDEDTDIYSVAAERMPVFNVRILSAVTQNGTNGYTFSEARARALNDSFHTDLILRTIDLENFYNEHDIRIVKYQDDLTNLLYFGYKMLTIDVGNGVRAIVPTTNAYIELTDVIGSTVSTITKNMDGSYTILPTTWFEYSLNDQVCTPLSDDLINDLAGSDKEKLIEKVNAHNYTRTPFHIRVATSHTYPVATSYNMMNPTITRMTITHENTDVAAQMLSISEMITHEASGSGGYTLRFIVKKDILDAVSENDITVYVYTTTSDGICVGTIAQNEGSVDGYPIYRVNIATDYYIDDDGNLNLTSLSDGDHNWSYLVPMEAEFHLVFMIKSKNFDHAATNTLFYLGVPDKLRENNTVLIRQKCLIQFGYSLNDVIYNNINLVRTSEVYATYVVDIPLTFSQDVPKCDEFGVPIINVVDGKLEYAEILHHRGDQVLGSDGKPMYLHRKGDVIIDAFGQPTVIKNRIQKYLIMSMMFDAKLFISEHPNYVAWRNGLTAELESYFKIIRNAQPHIRDSDSFYFRPSRTLGTGRFDVGDGVISTLPLAISLKLRVHVEPKVISDAELRSTLRKAIINLVEPMVRTRTISLTEMARVIKAQVEYVESVDVLGINGQTDLQTMTIVDDSIQPMLAHECYLANDRIDIKKSVDIEFVS